MWSTAVPACTAPTTRTRPTARRGGHGRGHDACALDAAAQVGKTRCPRSTGCRSPRTAGCRPRCCATSALRRDRRRRLLRRDVPAHAARDCRRRRGGCGRGAQRRRRRLAPDGRGVSDSPCRHRSTWLVIASGAGAAPGFCFSKEGRRGCAVARTTACRPEQPSRGLRRRRPHLARSGIVRDAVAHHVREANGPVRASVRLRVTARWASPTSSG
jgi:hypothetical protein